MKEACRVCYFRPWCVWQVCLSAAHHYASQRTFRVSLSVSTMQGQGMVGVRGALQHPSLFTLHHASRRFITRPSRCTAGVRGALPGREPLGRSPPLLRAQPRHGAPEGGACTALGGLGVGTRGLASWWLVMARLLGPKKPLTRRRDLSSSRWRLVTSSPRVTSRVCVSWRASARPLDVASCRRVKDVLLAHASCRL